MYSFVGGRRESDQSEGKERKKERTKQSVSAFIAFLCLCYTCTFKLRSMTKSSCMNVYIFIL